MVTRNIQPWNVMAMDRHLAKNTPGILRFLGATSRLKATQRNLKGKKKVVINLRYHLHISCHLLSLKRLPLIRNSVQIWNSAVPLDMLKWDFPWRKVVNFFTWLFFPPFRAPGLYTSSRYHIGNEACCCQTLPPLPLSFGLLTTKGMHVHERCWSLILFLNNPAAQLPLSVMTESLLIPAPAPGWNPISPTSNMMVEKGAFGRWQGSDAVIMEGVPIKRFMAL